MVQSKEKHYRLNTDNLTLNQWEILRNFITKNTKFIEITDFDGYVYAKSLTQKEIIEAKKTHQDEIIKEQTTHIKVISKWVVPYSYYYFFTNKRKTKVSFVHRIKYTKKVHDDLIRVMFQLETLSVDCAEFWYFYQAPVFFNQTVPILWKCVPDLVINLKNYEFEKFIKTGIKLIECEKYQGLNIISKNNTIL